MAPINLTLPACGYQIPFVSPIGYDGSTGNSSILCMDIDSSTGDIYIGGGFQTINGQTRLSAAAFTRKGVLKSWNPGNQVGAQVRAIKYTSSGVYLGGNFTVMGTNSAFRGYMACVDSISGAATSFDPAGGINRIGQINCVDVDVNGNVFWGGNGPNGGATYGALACDNTGSIFVSWSPQVNGPVNAIKCAGSGTSTLVYIGGYFNNLIGPGGFTTTRNSLAQINGHNGLATDGRATAWAANCFFTPPSSSPVQGFIYSMTFDSGGALYVAGEFDSIASTSRPYGLAGLTGSTPTVTSWNPTISGSAFGPYGQIVCANGNDIYWASDYDSTGSFSGLTGCVDNANTVHPWDAFVGPAPYVYNYGCQINAMVADPSNPIVPVIYCAGFFENVLNSTWVRGSLAKIADRTVTPTSLAF